MLRNHCVLLAKHPLKRRIQDEWPVSTALTVLLDFCTTGRDCMLVTLVVVIMGLLLWLLCIETVVVIEVRTSDKRVTNVLIAFLD